MPNEPSSGGQPFVWRAILVARWFGGAERSSLDRLSCAPRRGTGLPRERSLTPASTIDSSFATRTQRFHGIERRCDRCPRTLPLPDLPLSPLAARPRRRAVVAARPTVAPATSRTTARREPSRAGRIPASTALTQGGACTDTRGGCAKKDVAVVSGGLYSCR